MSLFLCDSIMVQYIFASQFSDGPILINIHVRSLFLLRVHYDPYKFLLLSWFPLPQHPYISTATVMVPFTSASICFHKCCHGSTYISMFLLLSWIPFQQYMCSLSSAMAQALTHTDTHRHIFCIYIYVGICLLPLSNTGKAYRHANCPYPVYIYTCWFVDFLYPILVKHIYILIALIQYIYMLMRL